MAAEEERAICDEESRCCEATENLEEESGDASGVLGIEALDVEDECECADVVCDIDTDVGMDVDAEFDSGL